MKLILYLMPGLWIAILASCSSGDSFRYEEGIAWNTFYHITYKSNRDLSDSIITVFERIDSSLSPFNENSVLTKVNNNISDSVDCHFITVYETSKKINRQSGGAFDPTLSPLIRAWGFGQGHEITSDTLFVDSLLQCIGIGKTHIENLRLIKDDPRIEFNFSALAKGYGVDCIADMLEKNGVENYLVEVGGEIRASGFNPQGNEWTIGIDIPDTHASPGEIINYVTVKDAGVATSGNYRNYHESKGTRFGHTISPRSGRPVETDVISATVIAGTCMEADALATTSMVIGSEAAISLCNELGVAIMIVKRDMTVVTNFIWSASEPGTEGPD